MNLKISYIRLQIMMILLFPVASFSLPPSIEAANQFVYSSHLKRLPNSYTASLDKSGNFNLVFTGLDDDENKPLEYVCFGKDGSISVEPNIIAQCGFFSCYKDVEILVDTPKVRRILFNLPDNNGIFKYLEFDKDCNNTYSTDIEDLPRLIISHIYSLPDGGTVINGLGSYTANGPYYELFYLKYSDDSKIQLISLPSLTAPGIEDNIKAELIPLSNDRFLLVSIYYNYDIQKVMARKTIVNIASETIEEFSYFSIEDSISYVYNNLRSDLNLGTSFFTTIGDSIYYWQRNLNIASNGTILSEGTSLYVLIFNLAGKLLVNEGRKYFDIIYENIDDYSSQDKLCRSNGFSRFWHDIESCFTPFGLVTFRKFPELIIDSDQR